MLANRYDLRPFIPMPYLPMTAEGEEKVMSELLLAVSVLQIKNRIEVDFRCYWQ